MNSPNFLNNPTVLPSGAALHPHPPHYYYIWLSNQSTIIFIISIFNLFAILIRDASFFSFLISLIFINGGIYYFFIFRKNEKSKNKNRNNKSENYQIGIVISSNNLDSINFGFISSSLNQFLTSNAQLSFSQSSSRSHHQSHPHSPLSSNSPLVRALNETTSTEDYNDQNGSLSPVSTAISENLIENENNLSNHQHTIENQNTVPPLNDGQSDEEFSENEVEEQNTKPKISIMEHPNSINSNLDMTGQVFATIPSFLKEFIDSKTGNILYKIPYGSTVSFTSPDSDVNSFDDELILRWTTLDGDSFSVRSGSNYKKNKSKSNSSSSIAECIGVDLFSSEQKINHIARFIDFQQLFPKLIKSKTSDEQTQPEISKNKSDSINKVTKEESNEPSNYQPISENLDSKPFFNSSCVSEDDLTCGVPSLFIFNFQIPSYAPGYVWSSVDDGEGFNVVMYFLLTDRAKFELKSKSTSSVILLQKFLTNLNLIEFHNRMKCIPRSANMETCDLGAAMKKLMKSYNAKPFLTGPHSHSFFRGYQLNNQFSTTNNIHQYQTLSYLECDIDVHKFCYMARKAAFGFMGSLKTMIIDVAFVIEGISDDELPEQILGCVRLFKIDPTKATNIQTALQQIIIRKGK